MKKKLYLLTALLLAFGFSANAQKQSMTVHKTDGTSVTYKSSEVLRIEFVDGTGAGTGTGTGEGDNPGTGGGDNPGSGTGTDRSGEINGRKYVDLGLPSGTLWAANDMGDYFAWGETSPKGAKKNYAWWTYFDVQDPDADPKTFWKYGQANPTLLELEPEDDAAYVNWGPEWRIPSKEQFEELKENCTLTYMDDYASLCFKSKINDNYIQISYNDYKEINHTNWETCWGYFWTRNIPECYSEEAYNFEFAGFDIEPYDDPHCYIDIALRYVGLKIRPVLNINPDTK